MSFGHKRDMDFTSQALTYGLLLIPSFFALAVTGQGLYKVTKGEGDGKVVLGFGIIFLLVVAAAYFFFIR